MIYKILKLPALERLYFLKVLPSYAGLPRKASPMHLEIILF